MNALEIVWHVVDLRLMLVQIFEYFVLGGGRRPGKQTLNVDQHDFDRRHVVDHYHDLRQLY